MFKIKKFNSDFGKRSVIKDVKKEKRVFTDTEKEVTINTE